MADRSSARLFGRFLELLAANPTPEHKAIAVEVWAMARDYDFSSCQMGEDARDAAFTLGIARLGEPDEYGTTTLWLFEDFEDEA